ncbi:ATP-binding protein [Bacillus sp. AFS041924]|nr:ATP-binding protein [Bacillus sp. AFS041924]
MAGGKTTLAKALENQLKNFKVKYENPYPIVNNRNNLKLDLHTLEGFVKNQRMFIEAEIKRYIHLSNDHIILDRGPEDIEFYTLFFPIANGYSWDIENLLKDELTQLRKCRSDLIIYLDAEIKTLETRRENDWSKRRNSFEQNMKLYKYEKNWYKQFNTKLIDVNEKDVIEVEKTVIQFLSENDLI